MLSVDSIDYMINEDDHSATLRIVVDFDAECLVDLIKESGRDDAAYDIGDKLFERIVKFIDGKK